MTMSDIAQSLMLAYVFDAQNLIPNRGRDFSLYHCVHTGSGIHPASFPVMGVLSLVVK